MDAARRCHPPPAYRGMPPRSISLFHACSSPRRQPKCRGACVESNLPPDLHFQCLLSSLNPSISDTTAKMIFNLSPLRKLDIGRWYLRDEALHLSRCRCRAEVFQEMILQLQFQCNKSTIIHHSIPHNLQYLLTLINNNQRITMEAGGVGYENTCDVERERG